MVFQGVWVCGIDDLEGICVVIFGLFVCDFYKSMIMYVDYCIWQDVYYFWFVSGVKVYFKLSVVDDVIVVFFKEL